MFFRKRNQLLKDEKLDAKFEMEGFLKFGQIELPVLDKLRHAYKLLAIPDSYGFGFNVGLNTENESVRRAMQEQVSEIIKESLLEYFIDRKVFTATFMNKVSGKDFLLPPHQDWTYTNELKDDSLMCWIPLVDVAANNGALCYMPKSHKLFSYDRAFPLSYMPSPVNSLNYDLLAYMQVAEAKAGEIILINHKTVHASLPNTTNQERVAVGVSVSPKNEPYLVKCLNPMTNGKTILTFEVDKDFLVKNRHVDLTKSYDHQMPYTFEYKLLNEEKLKLPSINMGDVKKFAKKNHLEFNAELEKGNFSI